MNNFFLFMLFFLFMILVGVYYVIRAEIIGKRIDLVYNIRKSFAEDGRGLYVYLPSYEHMLKKDLRLKTKEDFENKYVPKLILYKKAVSE